LLGAALGSLLLLDPVDVDDHLFAAGGELDLGDGGREGGREGGRLVGIG